MAGIGSFIYRSSDWLAFGLMLFIGYLSLTPLSALPDVPGGDKLQHFIAYVSLAFFTALPRKSATMIIAALLAVIAYGGLIELLQPYVNRYGEFLDFVANGAGAALGGLSAYGVMRFRA